MKKPLCEAIFQASKTKKSTGVLEAPVENSIGGDKMGLSDIFPK